MNRYEIFEMLELPPKGILISSIELQDWGSVWIFHCLYDADNPKEFDLTLFGCRKCTWTRESEISENDDVADLIGIFLGKKHHVAPAYIHTDLFDVEIDYDDVAIQKKWQST